MKDSVPQEHKANAPVSVGCFVLTMSDSKTPETDTSGKLIRELLTAAGHRVAGHAIVEGRSRAGHRGDPLGLRRALGGGVHPHRRDGHHQPRLDLRGHRGPARQAADRIRRAFPHASYQEIGAAAMLSRAQGGVVQGRVLFSLPGSPNACRLALEKLIIPELPHLIREVRR